MRDGECGLVNKCRWYSVILCARARSIYQNVSGFAFVALQLIISPKIKKIILLMKSIFYGKKKSVSACVCVCV